MTDPLAEAMRDRFWRDRCGEPAPGKFPIRCRRDIAHDEGHLGLRFWRDVEPERVEWPGRGNEVSAQTGPRVRCWCTLRREQRP